VMTQNMALPMGFVDQFTIWHAVIGVAEGIITALFLSYLLSVRPDLIDALKKPEAKTMRGVLITLGIITAIIFALTIFTSELPDGLEYVWEHVLGFE